MQKALLNTIMERDPDIQKAHNEYQKFTATDEYRMAYESRLKYQLDRNTDLYVAKQQGIEQGIEKGIEQEKKLEQQKEQAKTKKTIDNMLERKFSLEDIADILEIPIEKINALM